MKQITEYVKQKQLLEIEQTYKIKCKLLQYKIHQFQISCFKNISPKVCYYEHTT